MLTFSRTRKTLNFLADQVLTPNQDLGIKVATPAGTVFGQLIFGWLADVFGRKRMCESTASILVRCPYLLYALHEDGIEMMRIIVASFGQAMCGQAQAANIIGVLVVWRVVLGVGIGGDYPLSSVIPSEFASTNIRGRMMVVVGANQGWGQFSTSWFRPSVMLLGLTFVFVSGAAALVGFIIIEAFKSSLLSDDPANLVHVDFMWRLLIGLGCVPGAVALYFRLTIPETPRFTMDVERNVRQASQDVENFLTTGSYYVDSDAVVERVRAPKATKRDFMRFFSRKENLVPLIGMCYSWFAIDVSIVSIIPRTPCNSNGCPPGRVLRLGSQHLDHPAGNRFRDAERRSGGNREGVPKPEEHRRREHDPLRCRSHPWILGVIPPCRFVGTEASSAPWVHHAVNSVRDNGYVSPSMPK